MSGTGRDPWRWAVPGLLLLNVLVKLPGLGLNELAGDEPFTVYWAHRPLTELFGMLRTENNPPLYFLIMHGWSALVPLDAAWMRVPSAVFSILTVWPLYRIGKHVSGPIVGLTAALLFTFSGHGSAFAHEARAYSLLALATTWAIWELLRSAEHRGPLRRMSIAWLVVANALAVWTHYFGWLVVGLELVMVFSVAELRPVRLKMLAAAGLTVVLSLPWAGTLLSRAGDSLGHGTWIDVPSWEEPYNMLMRWSNAPVVAVLFLLLILVALVRGKARSMAVPLLWCGLPLIGMFAVSFVFPVYIDRYLYFASMAFYLLVALSAGSLRMGKLPVALLPAGTVLAMLVTFMPWKSNGIHPSRVAAQVRLWQEGHTAVVIQPAWYELTYAWAVDPQLFEGMAPMDIALRSRGVYPVLQAETPALDSTVTTVVHIDAWAALTDPGQEVLRGLRTRFVQTDSVEADKKVMVRRFERR